MPSRARFTVLATAIAALLLLTAACSGGDDEAVESKPAVEEGTPPSPQQRPDEFVLNKGPVSPDGLQAIFATADLSTGEHRVGFVVTSSTGLVRAAAASVTSLFFPSEGSESEQRQTALAVFRPWPQNTRGSYTTRLEFDRPGKWGLEISVLDPEGVTRRAELFFDVNESTAAPNVGMPAIRSQSKTLDDVAGIEELTTGSLGDSDLYQLSLADGATSGLPTVVVMASPAFCTNAVCGPQVEVLQELKDKYKGQANFIHVDFYDNPHEIQGDLDRARLSPTVLEWGLPSSEWSFVIDRNGVISERFESFATLEELEQALKDVL